MNKLLIQHLIHDNNHYKLPINPRRVGVVLLKRRGLKENETYSLSGLPEIILIVKRTLKKELFRLNRPRPSARPSGGRDVIENLQ